MAEKVYLVAYDIQHGGSMNGLMPGKAETPAGYTEAKWGQAEFEGKGAITGSNGELSGFQAHQGANIVTCKMIELVAKSTEDAIKIVREKLQQNAGGVRILEKPNETNFKVVN